MSVPTIEENRVRCRPIGEADLDGVATVLAKGFPHREAAWFRAGLDRLSARAVPEGMPRYGFMLEHMGRAVGAVLLMFSARDAMPGARCNIACWYVEPEHRGHAAMLSAMALKYKGVTYLNVTPAPNTWPILEAQGYRRYCSGLFLAFPALGAPQPQVRVEFVNAGDADSHGLEEAEAARLREAAGHGCVSLVARTPDGARPFVFLPFRMRSGRVPLPVAQLAYCRDAADLAAVAGPVGRALLRKGRLAVLMDANGPVPGLTGTYTEKRGRKYCKGPGQPVLGDLLDTELVIFGL